MYKLIESNKQKGRHEMISLKLRNLSEIQRYAVNTDIKQRNTANHHTGEAGPGGYFKVVAK